MTVFYVQDNFEQPPKNESKIMVKKTAISESFDKLTESEDEPTQAGAGEGYVSIEEVNEAITAAYKENKKLQEKLSHYAQRKIIRIMGMRNDGRISADDIVSEAITRIINGDRKWYKSKVNKIEVLIYLTIVSLIRIEAAKLPYADNPFFNEQEAGIQDNKTSKGKNKIRIIPLDCKDRFGNQIENTVYDNEKNGKGNHRKTEDDFDFEKLDEEELISRLEKNLEEDETAFFVLQEILAGNKSNIDIASKIGVDVKAVENAHKRIKRKTFTLTKK